MVLTNTGVISSGSDVICTLGSKNDVVQNSGILIGSISMGLGNDLYDGRLGKVTGLVDGEDGNDAFRPGAMKETFFGGSGNDTVDFRYGGGVQVSLDGVFVNKGSAKGDTYADIERLFGSLNGADKLGGTGQDNDIRGFGGNDRLQAEAGLDVLRGGLGTDTLSGGANDDRFVFDALNERGDVITDFSMGLGNDDSIYVNDTGFGGLGTGAVLVSLGAARFKSGGNNQAGDANDRFIFRTSDTTLWFDRDGTGSAFQSVLIADLQSGAVLTAGDIYII
jgi:Ca2+-binding RTX toxin-like protein